MQELEEYDEMEEKNINLKSSAESRTSITSALGLE